MWVQYLGQEDLLEEGMASHSSILAWRIPWTEEPGRLQYTGLQRVGHYWSDWVHAYKVISLQLKLKKKKVEAVIVRKILFKYPRLKNYNMGRGIINESARKEIWYRFICDNDLLIHWLIHLFIKYFLSTYYSSGILTFCCKNP